MTIKTEAAVTAANQTADALACEDGILVQVGERDLATPPGSDKAYGVAAVYGKCAASGLAATAPWVLLNRFNFPGMYQDFFYVKTDIRVVIESLTFGSGSSTKVIVADTK